MLNIPPPILEATNGVLWFVLMVSCLGALWALWRTFCQIGSIQYLYAEEKASLALFVGFFGLTTRTANIWWMQHLKNHGHDLPAWGGWPTFIHVTSTLIAVVGIVCWLRCTLPASFGWRGWLAVTLSAIAFGIVTAL